MVKRQEKNVGALIVGAGPTGLTVACELARHGVPGRIVDKAAAPSDKSKALAIQARTLEVFEAMGVAEEMIASGQRADGVTIHVRDRAARVRLQGLDSCYPFVLILEQSETERILERRLKGLGVEVERQVELKTFTQDAEGISAVLTHPDGQQESLRTRWLVGCDGAHSAVRHLLGLPFEGARYPEELWLADVRLQWPLPSGELHAFLGRTGVFAGIPMPGGYHRVILWSQETNRGGGRDPTLGEVQALIGKLGPPGTTVRDPIWLASFRIHRRIVPALRQERVFLAGDAAHIHSPAGGQGMNTGIQDAYNLAWKLALVNGGWASPSLLDSYHAERHPVAVAVLRGTNLFTRMLLMQNPVLRALRDLLLPVHLKHPSVQARARLLVSELGIRYRHSPIVAEHVTRSGYSKPGYGPGPAAGDRAPGGVLVSCATQATERLFDLLHGTTHDLLLFAGPAPSSTRYQAIEHTARTVRERYGRLVTIRLILAQSVVKDLSGWYDSVHLDPGHALHRRYGAASSALYLVRPDGYIAFRSLPAEGRPLLNYLHGLFAMRP